MAPERYDRPWTPVVDDKGEIVAGAKPAAQPAAGVGFVLPSNSQLSGVPATPDLERDRVYSLPELIDIAQSNNPLARTAWNTARETALAAGIARSTYLPRLTASVVGGYRSSDDNGSVRSIDVDTDVTAHGTISALSIQWLLFDFGKREAVVKVAEHASVISNVAFTAVHQHIIHAVSLAYYAHTAAQARVVTAVQSLSNAQQIQSAAEQRHANGIGTVIEVAQARQATAQAQLLKVQAEGAAQDAYVALLSAMGISPLAEMKIADTSDRKLPAALPGSLESVVADSLSRRPDMLTAQAAHRASEENVRAARAEFMPKVFLSATGAYNSGHLDVTTIPAAGEQLPTVNLSQDQFGVTVFAGFTVPVYDGGTRAAILSQARAKADSASAALTRVREEATREIVSAANTLRTSLAACDAATALAAAAQTTFDAALASYRNGVGSITEVTLADTQLLQARNVLSDTRSAALAAAATFALAAGTLGSAPRY